jgi:BirA family biotin operon repressor/biotin-[acetyl-CoA-carboxylase] ligase
VSAKRRPEIEDRLGKRLAAERRVLWLDECGSTMDIAREHVGNVTDFFLVAADSQTAGRGRQGREWQSVPGAFQGTFIYLLSSDPNPAATLAVGLAVSETLERFGVNIKLKWPNDLISSSGRKLGGILTEYISRPSAYLIGIGINLVGINLEIGEARIGSVQAEYGVLVESVEFAATLWPILERYLRSVQSYGFAEFVDRWCALAAFVGAEFTVEIGGELVVGVFQGVNSTGAMLLSVEGHVREISTGHIVKIKSVPDGR